MAFDGKVKGTHISNVVNYIRKKRGILGVKRLMEIVNDEWPETRLLRDDAFREGEWYPYDLYMEFLKAGDIVAGSGDLSRCFEIGYFTIRNLGHLSYLTRAENIYDLVHMMQAKWNVVYDFGRFESVLEKEGRIVVRYHDIPYFPQRCEYFRGSLTSLMNKFGLDGKVVEMKCCKDDSPYCEYELTWS